MSNILFGNRYQNIEDEEFKIILKFMKLFHDSYFQGDIISALPWLRFFPMQTLQWMKQYVAIRDEFFEKKVADHHKRFDPNNVTSFLDSLISSSYDAKFLQQNDISEITDESIGLMLGDMMIAGIDSTYVNLLWSILYLLHHPSFIEDALKEIYEVVGHGSYPELKHRKSLHVVQAIIQETLRMTVGPFTLPHKAMKDSSISGKKIMKDTQVLFHLWGVHHDVRHWDKPYEFNPKRWLDDNGEFNAKANISFMPFSFGKRSCIGEQMARVELFIFLTRLLIDFKITPNPDEKLPKISDGTVGLLKQPSPFTVILTKR